MKRKFSIYIVFIFTILIVMTVSGIIAIVYCKNKKSAMDNATEQFKKEAQVLIESTDKHLKTAQLTAEVTTEIFNRPDLKLELQSEECSYLVKALITYKQIALIYYGDEHGSFLQAAEFGNEIYTKLIHRKDNKAFTIFNYLDKDGNVLRSKTETDSKYDPRIRPWYIGAKTTKKIFWTDPYIFFENGQPGITVAVPIFFKDGKLQGVVAADITLDGLSDFMKQVKLSENGMAYITDAEGKLLAFSKDQEIVVIKEGNVRSLSPAELRIPAINDTLKAHQNKNQDLISFPSENEQYLAAFLPFPDSFGKKWDFTIIAPEDDFTGEMKVTLRHIIYLSLGALAIGVLLTMLLAQRISKPIELLAKDVLEVRNFNLDGNSGVKSHIHEIQTMDNAIKAMKNSLKAFRLYLPAVLVKQLIESGEDIAIGGKERELTIFFSDIQDYTPISETLAPQELMLQLSEYFDTMTTVIEGEKGTVDKFIADSVMAFWNAPLPNDNHHFYACKAALRCQQQLKNLNEKWEKEGKKIFNTRIGIHTSLATVGNMGAKQRMNYTALGDGVNLASRLEGVNKIYRTNIIISHETYKHVNNLFECRFLDEIAVKGKNQSVRIYELLAEHDSPEGEKFAKFAKSFEEIYETYLNRDWKKSKKLFQEFSLKHPEDHVCKLYIERCENFLKNEPGKNWNGVTKLDTK